MVSTQFTLGNQTGWYHTNSVDYGHFHTYDNFKLGDDTRKVQVFLPKDYENKQQRYPVIYMNDGNTAFYSGGLSQWSWEVDKTLDFLYEKHIIQKVIIVAVYPVDRVGEYLTNDQYFKYNSKKLGKNKGVAGYSDYLALKLKKFIDEFYFTDTDPAKTTIIGSSFGGTAAMYIGSKYPDKFGIAGVMSGSFPMFIPVEPLSDTEDEFVLCKSEYMDKIDEFLSAAKRKPKLWVDWGKYETSMTITNPLIVEHMIKEHNYVEGENLFFMEDPLGQHDERAWQYRFNLFLAQFYPRYEQSTS
ncbi:MAG: esterase family protein [bacterium]|nr:esterase family protein [bacterium]